MSDGFNYYKVGEKVAIRKGFGEAFYHLAKNNENIVVVTADLGGSLTLNQFWTEFPNRYFNCGVAEENMIGICAGLALTGYLPFAGTFAAFLGRSMDHIRQSILHNKLNVKIVGSHGGVSNAKDGSSAHAISDIAMFRSMPNMAVIAVADANQVYKAIKETIDYPNPVYLRLYREPLPVFTTPDTPFEIGKANVMRKGSDVTIVTCGQHVGFCLDWAEQLSSKFSIEVIDSHTIKPLDVKTIVNSAKKTQAVVTVEDHFINGGLGSAVAETLAEVSPTPLRRVGLRDYAPTGDYMDLINMIGIGKNSVEAAIEDLMSIKGVYTQS